MVFDVISKSGETRKYTVVTSVGSFTDSLNSEGDLLEVIIALPFESKDNLIEFITDDSEEKPVARFFDNLNFNSYASIFQEPIQTTSFELFIYNEIGKISEIRYFKDTSYLNSTIFEHEDNQVFIKNSDQTRTVVTNNNFYNSTFFINYDAFGNVESSTRNTYGNQTIHYSFNNTNEITGIEIIPRDDVGEISYTYSPKTIRKLDDYGFQGSTWFYTYGGFFNCNDDVYIGKAVCYQPKIEYALNPYYKLFADFGYLFSPFTVPLKPFIETGGEIFNSPESQNYVNTINALKYPVESKNKNLMDQGPKVLRYGYR